MLLKASFIDINNSKPFLNIRIDDKNCCIMCNEAIFAHNFINELRCTKESLDAWHNNSQTHTQCLVGSKTIWPSHMSL